MQGPRFAVACQLLLSSIFCLTKMSANFSNSSASGNDFFRDLDLSHPFKTFSIVFSSITLIILPPFLLGIVWFEKYGSDHKRTLINMLVSSICWTALQCGVIVQTTDIIRHTFGPLPRWICLLQAIVRSSTTSDFLLFYDAIIIVRFVYIFVLKNPAGFSDSFWCLFINICVKSFSVFFQTIWHLTASRQPIGFYVCTGFDPSSDDRNPIKVYGVVEIFSLVVHLFVFCRIQVSFKQKMFLDRAF